MKQIFLLLICIICFPLVAAGPYYQNTNKYPVEIPTKGGVSMTLQPGQIVEGSYYAGLAAKGILSLYSGPTPAVVYSYTEPVVQNIDDMLPSQVDTEGQFLKSVSKKATWAAVPSVTIPGANTQVIFNDNGNLGATDKFTVNKTTGDIKSGNFWTNNSIVSIGYSSLPSTTAANDSVVIGDNTGKRLTSGSYGNIAVGSAGTLDSVTTQTENTIMGYVTARFLTSSRNTIIGSWAGYRTGPDDNTGNALTTGSSNVFIGYKAGLGSPTQVSDSVAIGNGAFVNADSTVVLGGSYITQVLAGSNTQAIFRGKAIQLKTATRPTCDVNSRGTIWYVAGGTGVADTIEVCGKAAADTYSWVAIATF